MEYGHSNMEMSEELATLFRNMTFQQQQPAAQQMPQEQPRSEEHEPEPIRYSITQHYHHSAHIAQQNAPVAEPQRPSSVPPQTMPSAEQVLGRHGIDPSRLSPQQLDLFKTADTPQQIRLIELWQICPPSNPQQTNQAVTWSNTTFEQEEQLARLRYEQQQAEEEARRNSIMSLDGTPLTPVQTTDGRWVSTADVEPYMMSGYEMMARREYEESAKRQLEEEMMSRMKEAYCGAHYRPATDPVYANDWSSRQQDMEDQYGLYQQMRY